MLKSRLRSAALIISTSLVFVWLDASFAFCPGFWMIPLGFFLVFGSALECARLVRNSQYGSIGAPALLGTLGIMLAAVVPAYWPLSGEPYPANCSLGKLGWPLAAGCISLISCFCWYIPTYQPGSQSFLKAILAGWISVYFGGCFSFAVALRLTEPASAPSSEGNSYPGWGLFLLVGVIVLTKVADAGAYFMGRAIGRTKLCPQVSPGKTIEGLVGGVLAASAAGWLYFFGLAPLVFQTPVQSSVFGVVILGLLLTLAGVIGDLVESLFKREMDSKDSGNLLPGLGGLWDVTDSLLPAFVVAHLVVTAGLLSGPVAA